MKTKKDDSVQENAVEAQVENGTVVEETPVAKEEKTKAKAQTKVAAVEIPEFIKKVLKGYPDEEKLYVDLKGSVYTLNTPEPLRQGCTLYTNPYYNS